MIFFPLNTSKNSGYWAVAAAFILIAGISLLERHISIHRSLVVFYSVPIFLATWYAGPRAGLLIALSTFSGFFFSRTQEIKNLYYNPMFFYSNIVAGACFWSFLVFLFTRLKSAMMREQELSKLASEQNEALKKLNELKSAYVANVSHELKNPLAVIRESMSLILDKITGEVNVKQKEILEIGKRSMDRLIRLVSNLLDLSQIAAGKMKLKEEEIHLNVLVGEVLKSYEGEISKKPLVLKKEISSDVGTVEGDRDKLAEVVINLLNNAIKYTPAGSITVKLIGIAEEVRFEITDSGPGIPQEYLFKIFDKFERILAEKQEGTGLGLPIAKDIIELHKGKLWVESEAGKGSKFIFTLPRKQMTSASVLPAV